MNDLIILCDGGLGNRLSGLTSGLVIANKLCRNPIVCWPRTQWCDCLLTDLIATPFKQIDYNILRDHSPMFNFILFDKIIDSDIIYYPVDPDSINFIKNDPKPLVFSTNVVPAFISDEDIKLALRSLDLNNDITSLVDDFSKSYDITSKVFGIHIRKTDVRKGLTEEVVKQYVSDNPDKMFLICSDSDIDFSSFLNVIIFPKSHYPNRISESSPWRSKIVTKGIKCSNIYRSKESIVNGLIDMLLLSKTTIILDDKSQWRSTFLEFARRFSSEDIVNNM